MTTKAQAVKALAKVHPDAVLEDGSVSGDCYHVDLIAPKGHHWSLSEHCRSYEECDHGDKSEFWNEVLHEISLLDGAVPCSCEDDPCEGVHLHGECEYWGGE
tara:strand:- start:78 stop:383 length:306 start_codon:yes stop_codon:yes gene_type:complete